MDLSPRLSAAIALLAFLVALCVSYFEVDIPVPKMPKITLRLWKSDTKAAKAEKKDDLEGEAKAVTGRLLTPKELARYDGGKGSKGLYLGLVGRVFDVAKGKQHYGPGGGYHFFAGKDGSRAFVTGDFTAKGLIDDVSGLDHQDYLGIEDWLKFYEKDYEHIGYVEGSYYDAKGRPTEKLRELESRIAEAHAWKAAEKAESDRFPSCNSEWSEKKGSRVWCTTKR